LGRLAETRGKKKKKNMGLEDGGKTILCKSKNYHFKSDVPEKKGVAMVLTRVRTTEGKN